MSRSCLLLALCLGLASVALAVPNVLGATGLLLVPTADALSANEVSAGIFGFEHGSRATYAFNYGMRENFEAGFARYQDRETVINMKYNFQPENGSKVGVALGVLDLTDQVNTSIYVVASKKLILDVPGLTNVRLHAGLAGGGKKGTDIPLDGFFSGLSFDVTKNALVMVEHDGNTVNFGLGILLGKGFQLTAGEVGDDQTIVYGLGYNVEL